jgi:spermidine synthase
MSGDPPSGRAPRPQGGAWLLATVFASGAAVMIVEMTAVRAVQPFFGSTTFVWTNVISVVLAALAAGYAVGGRVADRWPRPGVLYGVLAAGGALLVLTAWLATPVSRLFLAGALDEDAATAVLFRGSLGATLCLFAPPILLLGTISPIAVRLLSARGVGRAAGSVFAVGTVGSIVGTYLPTLLLVPRLGSRGSILVAAAILLLAGAGGLLLGRRRAPAAAALLLAALAAGRASGAPLPGRPAPALLEGGVSTVLAEAESPYQYLSVREDRWPGGAERVLTVNEAVHAWHALKAEGRVLTGVTAYDAYTLLPFLLDVPPGEPLRALVVGLACGVNAAQWRHFWGPVHPLHVEGAEIDPAVLELGRRWFGLPAGRAPWLVARAMDGRHLLEATTRPAHAVVVDAFTSDVYVPFHLATREFFDLCLRRLEPGGVLAMNVFARGDEAPHVRAIEATLAHVFGACTRLLRGDDGGFVLFARKGGEVDLQRLWPEAVQARYGGWEGYAAWRALPEMEGLLALARQVAQATVAGHAVRVVAGASDRVLTDDHAPLEWLTDRYLRESERQWLGSGAEGAAATRERLRRQGGLLLAVGAAWLLLLASAAFALYRKPGSVT